MTRAPAPCSSIAALLSLDNQSPGTVETEAPTGGIARALVRRAWLIGACVLLAAGAALVVSLLQTKQYTANASLLFRDPGFDERIFGHSVFENTDPDREAATNVRLVSLEAVADLTAKDLPGNLDGDNVSNKVAIGSDPQSDVVTISATDPSPEFAAQIANTFATDYIGLRRAADRSKVRQAIRLVKRDLRELSPAQQQGSAGQALQLEVSRLQTLEAVQTGNAELAQSATVPSAASSPKTMRNVVLAAIVGLVLGIGLAFLRERFDRKLRDPREIEAAFGDLPVLVSIADCKALRRSKDGMGELLSSNPEALQMLRTRLRYFNVDREIRSVLVTSSTVGEGKTTIAWNLAASAASAGVKTILVEADLRGPSVAKRLHADPTPGLSELLSGQSSLQDTIQFFVEDYQNGAGTESRLDVIVAGSHPPNPAKLLESAEMARLLNKLTTDYEMVVIDAPPVLRIADAIPLLSKIDGVLVVCQLNKTTPDEAMNLSEQLRSLDAPILGIVANRVPPRAGYARYGYADY
jgi:succinoglycan biosynthesis transport protein ExoP